MSSSATDAEPPTADAEVSPADHQSAAPTGDAAGQAVTDAPAALPPVRLASAWTDALRARNEAALLALAELPFELRDSETSVSCKNARASDTQQLRQLLACLLTDDLLAEELAANPAPETTLHTAKQLPPWAKRWRKMLGKEQTAVSVYIPGNGITYYFMVVVEQGRVRELWKHAEFDPN